jgi:polyferredoxin
LRITQKGLKPLRVVFSLTILAGFILVFSDVRAKLPSSITTVLSYLQFWPSVQKFTSVPGILACGFIVVLILTLFAGRVYCSTICPLGILQDILIFFRRKIYGKKARFRYKKPMNFIRYSLLGSLIVSILLLGIFLANLLDPFANFGRILSTIYQPILIMGNNTLSKVLMSFDVYSVQPLPIKEFYAFPFIFSMTLLIGLILLVYYRGRLYCNTICPVGALLGILSKVSFLKVKIEKSHCSQCGKCQTNCKANCINIKELTIDVSRCIACFNCISSCEESSIRYGKSFSFKGKTGEKQDIAKRNFLKSGIFYMASYSMLGQIVKTGNDVMGKNPQPDSEHSQSNKSVFFTRGPVTPPGSVGIDHLKSNCIGCQLCISVCPTKVLQPSFLEYGITGMMLPRMNNDKGFCNYECTKCGEVCPAGAILPLTRENKKLTQIGTVIFERQHCVVYKSEKSCGSCSEHCPTQAVHMIPYKDYLTIPETNSEICIGCGACEHVCPVSDPHPAIYVMPNKIHKLAQKPGKENKVKSDNTQGFPF